MLENKNTEDILVGLDVFYRYSRCNVIGYSDGVLCLSPYGNRLTDSVYAAIEDCEICWNDSQRDINFDANNTAKAYAWDDVKFSERLRIRIDTLLKRQRRLDGVE